MTPQTIHEFDQVNAQIMATMPSYMQGYVAELLTKGFNPCDALYIAGEVQKALVVGLWYKVINEKGAL